MCKKFLFVTLSVLVCSISFSQTVKILSTQNGFEIAYQAQKISDGKKDKWLVTVTAVNKTESPLFYGVPTLNQNNAANQMNDPAAQFSSKVAVRNVTGFLANDGVRIKGELTNFFTENKSTVLLQYAPGRIYNYENSINVKHGDTLIVTVSHAYPLKKLSEFNLEISGALIDGDYKTSCGSNSFGVSMKVENEKTFLLQSVNGKQIKWIKSSATLFLKETDSSSTLSYNRDKKTFSYSSTDGINCEWTRL